MNSRCNTCSLRTRIRLIRTCSPSLRRQITRKLFSSNYARYLNSGLFISMWCFIYTTSKHKKNSCIGLNNEKNGATTKERLLFLALHQGFFVLLLMGIFLHVFEDSMVNYLFSHFTE